MTDPEMRATVQATFMMLQKLIVEIAASKGDDLTSEMKKVEELQKRRADSERAATSRMLIEGVVLMASAGLRSHVLPQTASVAASSCQNRRARQQPAECTRYRRRLKPLTAVYRSGIADWTNELRRSWCRFANCRRPDLPVKRHHPGSYPGSLDLGHCPSRCCL